MTELLKYSLITEQMKPHIHCRSSVKKFWWIEEDYMAIHDFIDCSKVAFWDNRHRALTHNNWFVFIVEKVFGHTIKITPSGQEVSVREIAEQHILEDFKMKFIPNVQDYLNLMAFPSWLNNWAGPDLPQSCWHMAAQFRNHNKHLWRKLPQKQSEKIASTKSEKCEEC